MTRTPQDEKVEIKLTNLSDTATKVSIHVGVFGDEAVSRTVLDPIRGGL